MKTLFSHSFVALVSLAATASASESGLTRTWQPIDGLGDGGIAIESVTCFEWNAMSGMPTRIYLIAAPNNPPTFSPEHNQDINLASICHLSFAGGDPYTKENETVVLEATKFVVPPQVGGPKEDIIKASLECLRRALPDTLAKAPISFKAADKDREWIGKIVAEFNAHDRTKPFYTPKD